jgi:hypothetical protein
VVGYEEFLSCAIQCCIVRRKSTDGFEQHVTSIFRVEYAKEETDVKATGKQSLPTTLTHLMKKTCCLGLYLALVQYLPNFRKLWDLRLS